MDFNTVDSIRDIIVTINFEMQRSGAYWSPSTD